VAEINKKVGARIRKYRKEKKWTQEKLAFISELHRAYIGHIERGEKNIGLENLEKIAKALKTQIKDLIE
jgi:transcriptional regulator with XRE-family HTH domain